MSPRRSMVTVEWLSFAVSISRAPGAGSCGATSAARTDCESVERAAPTPMAAPAWNSWRRLIRRRESSFIVFILSGIKKERGACAARSRMPEAYTLYLRHAAVHAQVDAGDEAAFVRRQEQRGGGDFFGTAHAAQRHHRREHGAQLVGADLLVGLDVDDRRVDRAGAQRVDADAALFQFHRPGAGERTHGGLAGAVGAVAGHALDRGDRRGQ